MVDIDWTDFSNYESIGGRLNEHEFENVIAHEPNWPTYRTASELMGLVKKTIVDPEGLDEHATVIIAKLLGALPYDHPVNSRERSDKPLTRVLNESSLITESYRARGLDPQPYEQAERAWAIASTQHHYDQMMREDDLERKVYNES